VSKGGKSVSWQKRWGCELVRAELYVFPFDEVPSSRRLSQSRSLGFLVWCGRTHCRATRSKSSTCEQVYVFTQHWVARVTKLCDCYLLKVFQCQSKPHMRIWKHRPFINRSYRNPVTCYWRSKPALFFMAHYFHHIQWRFSGKWYRPWGSSGSQFLRV